MKTLNILFFCISRIHAKDTWYTKCPVQAFVSAQPPVPSIGRKPKDMFSLDDASTLLATNHETHKTTVRPKTEITFFFFSIKFFEDRRIPTPFKRYQLSHRYH